VLSRLKGEATVTATLVGTEAEVRAKAEMSTEGARVKPSRSAKVSITFTDENRIVGGRSFEIGGSPEIFSTSSRRQIP
jgi:hypothetical protein